MAINVHQQGVTQNGNTIDIQCMTNKPCIPTSDTLRLACSGKLLQFNGAVLAVNRKPYNYYSITFC